MEIRSLTEFEQDALKDALELAIQAYSPKSDIVWVARQLLLMLPDLMWIRKKD